MARVGEIQRTDGAARGRAQPAYARVQRFGLTLAGATVLVISIIAVVSDPAGLGEALAFFAPLAAAMLLGAWLTTRFGAWANVVGLVIALAGALFLFWTAFGLAAPDSFVDFMAGVGVPIGLLLAVVGGLAAIVARRRGRVQVEPTRGELRVVRVVLVVVTAVLAVSGVLTMLGRGGVDATVAAGATEVDMAGFAFVPAEIVVGASDPRLVVANRDAFLHDLAVPALDAIVRVTPGSSELLDLAGAVPGTYTVYCTLHSDTSIDDPVEAGMAGTLVIR